MQLSMTQLLTPSSLTLDTNLKHSNHIGCYEKNELNLRILRTLKKTGEELAVLRCMVISSQINETRIFQIVSGKQAKSNHNQRTTSVTIKTTMP